MNRLAELLEAERAKRDLTLTDFARDVLGIDHGMLSRYVNGVTQPSRRTVRKIADALGVAVPDIDAMLAEEDAKRRGPHRGGQGPTGHPADDDLREIIRQAALEGARIAAREVVAQMNRSRPPPDPIEDPAVARMVAEINAELARMTPEQIAEAQRCFRDDLQRHRRAERERLQGQSS